MEHGKESLLAIDDVFGSRKSAARQKRAFRAHAAGPRINGVFHVGQLAGCDRARTKSSRGTDADGRHDLLGCEIQHATRGDWCRERAQCRVMPAVLAHTWSADFAKAHFNFVGDDRRQNQIFAAEPFAFTQRERRGDEIARVTRVRFPINVVVIHRSDHVAVQKRRIDRIGFETGDERGGLAPAGGGTGGDRAVVFQQYLGVILLTAAERAPDGIEPE